MGTEVSSVEHARSSFSTVVYGDKCMELCQRLISRLLSNQLWELIAIFVTQDIPSARLDYFGDGDHEYSS